jgi:hypothetical protein
MISFIDAQADYTKKAAKVTSDAVTTIASESVKVIKQAGQFDYSKFGEGIMKAYADLQAKAEEAYTKNLAKSKK